MDEVTQNPLFSFHSQNIHYKAQQVKERKAKRQERDETIEEKYIHRKMERQKES